MVVILLGCCDFNRAIFLRFEISAVASLQSFLASKFLLEDPIQNTKDMKGNPSLVFRASMRWSRVFGRETDIVTKIPFLVALPMSAVPKSEIRVKFLACQFQKTVEKCGEILAIFSQIIVLEYPGKSAARNFTQIPPHTRTSNSRGREPKFFHCDTLGVGGPNLFTSRCRANVCPHRWRSDGQQQLKCAAAEAEL